MKNINLKKIDNWMTKHQSGLIIFIAVSWFICGFAVSDLMDEKGYMLAFATGDSMCPEIGVFSIALEKTKDFDLNKGDIVVYTLETKEKTYHVQHRIIGMEDGEYDIRGDNNDWSHLIEEEDIESKLVYSLDLVKCSWKDYVGVK